MQEFNNDEIPRFVKVKFAGESDMDLSFALQKILGGDIVSLKDNGLEIKNFLRLDDHCICSYGYCSESDIIPFFVKKRIYEIMKAEGTTDEEIDKKLNLLELTEVETEGLTLDQINPEECQIGEDKTNELSVNWWEEVNYYAKKIADEYKTMTSEYVLK